MGIWREHFHPSVWLRWEVLGWILGTAIAIAGLLLFFDQYTGANVCFGITAFFVFAKIAHVAVTTDEALLHRFLFAFLLFGLVGVGIVETMRGVNRWAEKKEKQQAGTSASRQAHEATEKGADVPKEPPVEKGKVHGTTQKPEAKPKGPETLDKARVESPFAVSVEWAMFSIGGKGYGTGFWAYYPSQNGCVISPIQAVFFIRVKNLRSTPVTVIGYSLDVFGVPLTRTNMGSIVRIPQKGSAVGPKKMSGYPINKEIHFGQGPGFSMVQFLLNESDFTQGFLLQMDLIENLLKTPLPPNIPIRGWAFYQSPNENAFSLAGPGHITLETDDSRTFPYDFDLRNPHPELDILDRVITAKSFIDLSGCKQL
jgi:hypothetical protein